MAPAFVAAGAALKSKPKTMVETILFGGKERKVLFGARLIMLYEQTKDRPFMQDYMGMVTDFQKTGFFKISFVADVAFLAMKCAADYLNQPLNTNVFEVLEMCMSDTNAPTEVITKLAASLPVAKSDETVKNAESPEPSQSQ